MIKIEVIDTNVQVQSGTSNRNGRPYTIRKQEAWAHLFGQRYPTKIEISLEDGQLPYQPGQYQLSAESLYVGKFARLEVGRVKLVPLVQKTAA